MTDQVTKTRVLVTDQVLTKTQVLGFESLQGLSQAFFIFYSNFFDIFDNFLKWSMHDGGVMKHLIVEKPCLTCLKTIFWLIFYSRSNTSTGRLVGR